MYNNWNKKCRFLGTFDKKLKKWVRSCEKKIGGNV